MTVTSLSGKLSSMLTKAPRTPALRDTQTQREITANRNSAMRRVADSKYFSGVDQFPCPYTKELETRENKVILLHMLFLYISKGVEAGGRDEVISL